MKVEHRAKALESYAGGRLVLKEGMVYPSYVLFKEATRAVLAYIAEDKMGMNFSEKSKLNNLMELMTEDLIPNNDMEKLDVFIYGEKEGLGAILAMDIEKLKEAKAVLKRLIGMYLGEHV